MKPLHILVPVLLLVPLAAAQGAEVVVPSPSQDAIGDAIEEAGAGGTVILDPGPHVLTTTVVVGLDSVTVRGRKGATILALGSAEGSRLLLFQVNDDRFTLEKVEIAPHPSHRGDVAVVQVADRHGTTVSDCEASGIVQLVDGGSGPYLTVRRNRVLAVDPTETEAPAGRASVIRCAGGGVVEIERNRLEGRRGAGTIGIEVLPPLSAVHYVERNRVVGFADGIAGEGAGRVSIRKNRVRECTYGIDVAQGTVAAAWEIRGNDVRSSVSTGIFVGTGERTAVSGNLVLRSGSDGINVAGVLLELRSNRSRLNGGRGIYGSTTTSEYVRNVVKRCGSGLRVEGSGNLLEKNNGSKNLGDGVVSVGGNVKGEGNRGRKNGGVQVSIQ